MLQNIELAVDLFRIYLRDESENANVAAIDAITHAFDAVCGALFYVDSDNKYSFCLTGTRFKIELPEERWKASIANHTAKDSIHSFTGWAPPGIDTPVEYWLAAPLYSIGPQTGYVFIGKNLAPWDNDETKAFIAVTEIVTEIVSVRYKKNLEAISRRRAENELAVSQRRMADFFESFHDMIYTTDPEDNFTSINSAGVALFGLESRDQIIGHPFSEFAVNSDVHDFFLQKIRKDGFIDDHEIVLKRENGTPLYCLETSYAVKTPDGTIVEIQGLIKDITDRIENEREQWKMNLELAEVNVKLQQTQKLMVQQEKLASIGQLAAGIAHEINNPLGFLMSNQTILKKYFDILRSAHAECLAFHDPRFDQLAKEKDLEYLLTEVPAVFSESDEGYSRILRIVSNLRTFSRMEQSTDFDLFDVNEGIESTLTVAWNEIKYVADIDKRLGNLPKIYARGGEINQVVLNILINAAQAITAQKRTDKGKIVVESRLEGSSVIIRITDDGPGIPQNILNRIFDPFFTTKEPGKGTGLGLSISYDIIVLKHKGKLSVTSEPGEGTCFVIELPVAPVD